MDKDKYANYGSGAIVFVHNSSFQPREEADGILVKPGEQPFIVVKRKFVNNSESPFTECQSLASYPSELYDFIVKLNKTFREKDYFDLCIQI